MNTMLVASFTNREQAEPWRSRLNENGIPAEIHDEPALGMAWFAFKAEGGVRIEVPEKLFERAYDLLTRWDEEGATISGLIRCPECRSLRVYYPQHSRRSLIPNLVVGTIATVARVQKEYYCEDCHYTWPKEGTRAARLGPHSAPNYFIEGIPPPKRPSEQDPPPDAADSTSNEKG